MVSVECGYGRKAVFFSMRALFTGEKCAFILCIYKMCILVEMSIFTVAFDGRGRKANLRVHFHEATNMDSELSGSVYVEMYRGTKGGVQTRTVSLEGGGGEGASAIKCSCQLEQELVQEVGASSAHADLAWAGWRHGTLARGAGRGRKNTAAEHSYPNISPCCR